ncbi:MAG: N-acetyl-gamma-glutamyl-phosphate reductase [Desulfuromonas sp.]|nr:MAG: N-acetyl-gamma-glutamyl-phosphate reductase [Desulfuromonas sp.]
MLRVAVMGASGYTGVELLRLLSRHPEVEITMVTSRQSAGEPISSSFPSLYGAVDLVCVDASPREVAASADLVFTALPHKTAMEAVPDLLDAGCKVVDLSADYRLKDVAVYEQWYQEHTSPSLLQEAVYGLPELYREQVRNARLVANPGCYPTSVALALTPLLREQCIDTSSVVVDSKSGTSGAGRGAKVGSLFCEVNEAFRAYGIAAHRHTPEIEQTLSDVSGTPLQVTFTPHLLPINRGILSTCYAKLNADLSAAQLQELFETTYADEPFVRVLPTGKLPDVAYVKGSNFCDVAATLDARNNRVVVVATIDNLVKGAAGQAIQNMNLLYGWPEETGLLQLALAP